ncbi:hypothetical protein ACIGW8_35745 [Streptomyces sioyaensis]|uniref:hypothetical protein n=1 Tax=Streptomyces sioyaensis TaxID=67364 RepID=UPI0037D36A17
MTVMAAEPGTGSVLDLFDLDIQLTTRDDVVAGASLCSFDPACTTAHSSDTLAPCPCA